MKISTKTAVFKRVSLIIGEATHTVCTRMGRFQLFFEVYEGLVIKSSACMKNLCAQNIGCLRVHLLPPQGGSKLQFFKKSMEFGISI